MSIDLVIDDLVETCNGDLRGAVMALLLINEQLENELQALRETNSQHAAATLQPSVEAVN
jgi:predicted RecB family endonuclease